MSKELKFYHPEFEQVVRQELLISDRAITNEDTLGKRFERVNDYLENAISELDTIVASLPYDKIEFWNELNDLFLDMLK